MSLGGQASLALLAGLSSVPAQGVAAAGGPAPRVVSASAADLFALTQHLLVQGQRDPAHRLLQLLSRDPNADVRNEARFRRALLLEEDGRVRDAAVLLRRILDDRPNATTVRLKLAAVLQIMGEQQAAFRQIRALQAADLPPAVAQLVDRLSGSLQHSKQWGIQVEAAIAPDSNINRATSNATLGTIFGDFEIADRPKSGFGVAMRGTGHIRRTAGDSAMVSARLSATAALYGKPRFNDIALGFAVGPEFMLDRTRLSAEAGLAQQWYGMAPYQRTVRLAGSVVQAIGSSAQVRLDPVVRWTNDLVNNLRDGHGVAGTVGLEHALSPVMAVAVTATAERFRAADDAYSTKSWLIGASVAHDVGRTSISVSGELGRLNADERLAILPRPREDKLARFSIRGTFRQVTFMGFAPMAKLVIERIRSTVEFHDFSHSRTEFGVSQAF